MSRSKIFVANKSYRQCRGSSKPSYSGHGTKISFNKGAPNSTNKMTMDDGTANGGNSWHGISLISIIDVAPQALDPEEDASTFLAKQINEEYKVWKKNAPYLYDLLVTHSLEWPSLTLQWFPDIQQGEADKDHVVHRMLVGTYTSGVERDYIGIVEMQLPKDDVVIDARKFDEERNGTPMKWIIFLFVLFVQ